MKVFTLEDGRVTEGAAIQKYSPCAGIEFPAIIIGENGRGRKLGILPVGGTEGGFLRSATIGTTRKGGPKLLSSSSTTEEDCIIVFRSPIGFRGGNSHTGDRYHAPCGDAGEEVKFHPWPGKNLVEGRIAQGDAGAMGSGTQIVAVMPSGVVFRIAYTGRRYDSPKAHYGLFDGQKLQIMTWSDRQVADMW